MPDEKMLPAVQKKELVPGVPDEVDLESLSSEEVRDRARALYFASRVLNVALAETLDHIIKKSFYNDYGWNSFDEYCEKELGMPGRQGYTYVQIFRSLRDNTPLTKEEMGTISTTKANSLRKLADAGLLKDEDTAKEWLETAQDLSLEQVKEQVNQALETAVADKKTERPTPDHPVKILRFPLFAEQLAVWQEAEARARTIAESDKPGHLLACICTAFNAEAWDGRKESLSKLCLSLERTFGVKVIALEPGDDVRVLYGENALAAFAAADDGEESEEGEAEEG